MSRNPTPGPAGDRGGSETGDELVLYLETELDLIKGPDSRGPSCHDHYSAVPRHHYSRAALRWPGPHSRHARVRLRPVGLEWDDRPPPEPDRPVCLGRRRRHRGARRPCPPPVDRRPFRPPPHPPHPL